MAIDPIGSGSSPLSGLGKVEPGGERFSSALARMLQDVNQDQVDAARKIEDLVVDGQGSIHDAMVAMAKAEGSFRLAMQLRNRLVESVNQLLSTQL